jgi:hypothetical protein
MKEGIYMENNKFERTIFTLLRVFGVLSILGAYLGSDGLFSREDLIVFRHKTIFGNVFMISPRVITAMIVTIILYLIFIRIIAKHISISKKSI